MDPKTPKNKDIEPVESHEELGDEYSYSYPSPKKSKAKKFLEGLGIGGLAVGGGIFFILFNILHFVFTAIIGLGMIWFAITLFLDGSIILGLLVLFIGAPLAIAFAHWAFIFLLILTILAGILWGTASLFGFDVSFDSAWDIVWAIIKIFILGGFALIGIIRLIGAIKKKKIVNFFKENWFYILLFFFLLWLFFLRGFSSHEAEFTPEEKRATEIVKDVLYDKEPEDLSEEEEKYVKIIKELYDPIKTEYAKFEEKTSSIDLSDLLTPSSFEDLGGMEQIVDNLTLFINSYEEYRQKVTESTNKIKVDEIARKYLDKKEAGVFVEGYKETYQEAKAIADRYINSVKAFLNEVQALYEFLIINYDYYELEADERGDQNIYFFYETDLESYNGYMQNIQILAKDYIQTEEEFFEYFESFFGGDLKMEDFLHYFGN